MSDLFHEEVPEPYIARVPCLQIVRKSPAVLHLTIGGDQALIPHLAGGSTRFSQVLVVNVPDCNEGARYFGAGEHQFAVPAFTVRFLNRRRPCVPDSMSIAATDRHAGFSSKLSPMLQLFVQMFRHSRFAPGERNH
jgi:hypothetical protein